MKIIVTGATGMIGAEVLRQAIIYPGVEEVIAIVRNTPAFDHAKITYVFHNDFNDYGSLKTYFERADAIAWCLGISQTQVNRRQYEAITFDYVVACAATAVKTNPSIRFVFVSGDGADRTEKSRTIFKRIKGKAENALLASGLKQVFIVRPDAVRPRHKNNKAPFAYRLVYPLFPLVELLAPNKIIWSDVLARAILTIASDGNLENTIENAELRKLGQKVHAV